MNDFQLRKRVVNVPLEKKSFRDKEEIKFNTAAACSTKIEILSN